MSSQNLYTMSIGPDSISQLLNIPKFLEFMDYFEKDCERFVTMQSGIDNFVLHFSKIREQLSGENLLGALIQRTEFHSRLTEYRVNPVGELVNSLWQGYVSKSDDIFRSFRDEIGKSISLPPSPDELESLSEEEKNIVSISIQKLQANYLYFIAGIGGLVNTIFFAFEAQSKTVCSLGCYAFSIKYSRNEIISHNDVWKTLKRIGEIERRQDVSCFICSLKSSCRSTIDFSALSNIYCYAIKVRMLSDYEDFFYNYRESWKKIKVFFDKLQTVILKEREIKERCMRVHKE